MASVNKIIIVGNLGRDPEIRFTANGDCIANLSIGTTDKWKDKSSGEVKEATEWHRVSVFGKSAEYLQNYAKKGSQIYVEGSLRTRKWQDKDGQDRYSTEVRADDVQLLGSRSQNSGSDQQGGGSGNGDHQQQHQGGNQGQQQRQGGNQQQNNQQRQGNNQQRQNNNQQRHGGYQGNDRDSGGGFAHGDDIPFVGAINRKNHHI